MWAEQNSKHLYCPIWEYDTAQFCVYSHSSVFLGCTNKAPARLSTCFVWPHVAFALQQNAEVDTSTLLFACVKHDAQSKLATTRETVAYSYQSINQFTFPVLGLFRIVDRQWPKNQHTPRTKRQSNKTVHAVQYAGMKSWGRLPHHRLCVCTDWETDWWHLSRRLPGTQRCFLCRHSTHPHAHPNERAPLSHHLLPMQLSDQFRIQMQSFMMWIS